MPQARSEPINMISYTNSTGTSSFDYSVGWLTLALINAGLAQSKRRSGLNWFLVSLLIGPLATLLLVIWEALPPPNASER